MKLKDQIHQTTQTTSGGILGTSHNDNKKNEVEDEFFDNIQTFEAKIARAKKLGQEWVETSKEMLDYVMPQGWKTFAIYKDVKICEFGGTQDAQAVLDETLYQKQFNNKEGVIESGV